MGPLRATLMQPQARDDHKLLILLQLGYHQNCLLAPGAAGVAAPVSPYLECCGCPFVCGKPCNFVHAKTRFIN